MSTDSNRSSNSHWVEGTYQRDDYSTFKARFNLRPGEMCPPTANDKNGKQGKLVEGSCMEVNQGCFIATAAFGSELHPRVQSLREFRDNVLLKSELSTGFEKVLFAYYKFSPPIAAAMMKFKPLKYFLKFILVYPVVLFAQAFVFCLKVTHRDWHIKNRRRMRKIDENQL